MANVCNVIIFIVIVAVGLAIASDDDTDRKDHCNSITEPVEQIEAAASLRREGTV